MGPPKENPPPFLFGKDFQVNLLVNDADTNPNSSVHENDASLAGKLFENPQIPDPEVRSANILQSSSFPPSSTKEASSSLAATLLEQEFGNKTEEKETKNVQIPFLNDKPSTQSNNDPTSIQGSTSLRSSIQNVNNSESLPAQDSEREAKPFNESQTANDAESDAKNIPKGSENAIESKETSSSNSPNASTKTKEDQHDAFEIAKKNLLISMESSKAFDDFIAKKTQKKTSTNSSVESSNETSFFTAEKKILQKSLEKKVVKENISVVQEAEKKTLQSPSAETNVENPPVPQYSETFTYLSNYEEREELRFFDRAKFIAICGEDFFDQSQEPWPQDVKLYQPYEVEQVILPDNANCLAVQAFLKMCGLDFQTEQRHNAEYMSPSGRVPFIKCGAFVVSELDPIIAFINTKGISLTGQLDAGQRADMRAYMSLANTVLANAELYVAWVDSTTANAVTRPRYGSVHPWPLNHIVTWQKGRQVRKRLAVLGWLQKSLQEVYAEVENCCNALSERLDKKDFFFGSRPTELDALVFGHLFTVLTTPLPSNRLASIVRGYPALVELVKRIEKQFFQREN